MKLNKDLWALVRKKDPKTVLSYPEGVFLEESQRQLLCTMKTWMSICRLQEEDVQIVKVRLVAGGAS